MKSKIEKVERIIVTEEGIVTAEVLAKVLNDIVGKQGEIIDHLNSQDQEEENECECCKWDDIGYTYEPYCLLFKEVKDTPEEWFTMEELAYLEEVMHLDYSLAVTFGQREKSDIGGGLLRKLDNLNNKKK